MYWAVQNEIKVKHFLIKIDNLNLITVIVLLMKYWLIAKACEDIFNKNKNYKKIIFYIIN